MTSILASLHSALEDDTIPWQKLLLSVGAGVALFEAYIG